MRRGTRSVLIAAAAAAAAACNTSSGPAVTGPERCTPPAGRTAVGCATVYGTVIDARGNRLSGVSGSVRFPASCDCLSPVIVVDDNGVFSVMVHRLRAAANAAAPDTATGTVVLFASDERYPRHVSGGMYFDTARVALRFVPMGAPPVAAHAALRIPLPLGGS